MPYYKSSEWTQNSSSSYKSTDDLPASVAECFQDSTLLGKIQNSLLLFIGRGSRYKIVTTNGCSIFSLLSQRKNKDERSITFTSGKADTKTQSKSRYPLKPVLKQANSLPVKPKPNSPETEPKQRSGNPLRLEDSAGNKYSHIDSEERLPHREDTLLRQYLSLQRLAISRRHCNQLRRIRDSLAGRACPKPETRLPTKEQEQLRNFLMDVGFVQYYSLLNRNGYDFETASHMDVLDLAAVGITEPLHRMALKYELDQVRRPIKPLQSIPETITSWLESISLSEYVEHFQQNGIFCPLAAVGLTKRDLQLMGIYMLGHRKKIVLALMAVMMGLSSKSHVNQEDS